MATCNEVHMLGGPSGDGMVLEHNGGRWARLLSDVDISF